MKNIVTDAAAITVLRLIDSTNKTGGGPYGVGATVVMASKGPVGKITKVYYSNWEDVYGKPYSKNTANRTQMEGLRHLNDAAKKCAAVNVVRVVAEDAMFPSMTILKTQNKDAWHESTPYIENDVVVITGAAKLICVSAHTSGPTEPTSASAEWDSFTTPVETSSLAYAETVATEDGYICSLYPIDGDPSVNRSIRIDAIDTEKERFTLQIYDKTETGLQYLLEYWTVGVNPLDKDDMGRSVFIETLLEERSTKFRCNWNPVMDWDDAIDSITEVSELAVNPTFEGGTNGGLPTEADWIAAWDMFRNEAVQSYLMFAAGCYHLDVLQNCVDIAELKHAMFFLDTPCYQNLATSSLWLRSSSLDSRLAAAYYCPIAANDEWYGGKTIWGASGAVAAACALGDANFSGETPGVHYSPAGKIRGKLERTGITFLFPQDVIDRDEMVAARLNPVIPGPDGGAIIDDSLTLNFLENYSRFVWVNRIANYIDYRFVELATALQHEPDRVTSAGLTAGMEKILSDLVISGALSKPRQFYEDSAYSSPFTVSETTTGESSPYLFSVTQPTIDRWMVQWEFCPTGSARRIVGQPIIIR